MAYIALQHDAPGTDALLLSRPDTGVLIEQLAERLLAGGGGLTRGERELIAAYVSRRNNSNFDYAKRRAMAEAYLPHSEIAERLFGGQQPDTSHLSSKMKAMINIAEKARQDARSVGPEDIAAARAAGATDDIIHDVVLLTAVFCMLNKYADALGAESPPPGDPYYRQAADKAADV